MRAKTIERDVSSSGALRTKQAGIKMGAKLAHMFSSQVYRNKYQAVLREYGCNAYDAHVMAGKPNVPFRVVLPSQFNPELIIQDFGTGLSLDGLYSVFLDYLDSSKDGTHGENMVDEQIGMFGLGSKSGFAYTDMLSIISVYNGTQYTLSYYKDGKGMPTMDLLHEKPTTQPNGVTIKIPVKPMDFNEFRDQAQKVFQFFDPIPDGIDIDPPEYALQGAGWAIQKPRTNRFGNPNSTRAIAIQGNVAYPIDSNAITGLDHQTKRMLELPLVIHFPIGALEPALSREELSYDTDTQAAIRKRLNEICDDLPNQYQAQFDTCSTMWEAKLLFKEIVTNARLGHSFNSILQQRLTFKGKKIEGNLASTKSKDGSVRVAELDHRATGRVKIPIDYHDYGTIHAAPETVIIWDDTTSVPTQRILKYHGQFHGLILRSPHFPQEQMDQLGNPPYLKLQDMPVPPKEFLKAERQKSEVVPLRLWQPSGTWAQINKDLANGGKYVSLENYEPKWEFGGRGFSDLTGLVTGLCDAGIYTGNVYGIMATHKRIAKIDGWENLLPWAKAEVERIIAARPDLHKQAANLVHWREFRCEAPYRFAERLEGLKRGNKLTKLIQAANDVKALDKDLIPIVKLASIFGIEFETRMPSHNLIKLQEEAHTKYPLLAHLDYRAKDSDVTAYINSN